MASVEPRYVGVDRYNGSYRVGPTATANDDWDQVHANTFLKPNPEADFWVWGPEETFTVIGLEFKVDYRGEDVDYISPVASA